MENHGIFLLDFHHPQQISGRVVDDCFCRTTSRVAPKLESRASLGSTGRGTWSTGRMKVSIAGLAAS